MKLLRKNFAEIIEWYKETEKVKSKLSKKQFITLTYPQITSDLENSINLFYKFIGKKNVKKFQKQVSDYAEKIYKKASK